MRVSNFFFQVVRPTCTVRPSQNFSLAKSNERVESQNWTSVATRVLQHPWGQRDSIMPRSKGDDAARKREERSVAFPEAAKKRKLQDAERKRRERDDATQAQAAAKQIAQGVVQPTNEAERKLNEAERKRRERQDAAQARMQNKTHGGSRERTGRRPRELSRGSRAYENMVAVATKQRLLWDAQNADAALGACAPVKVAADGTLQCVHPNHHTCDNCPNPGAKCEAINTRYAAATGVALVMEQPPGRVSELIRKCVHVSDEKKVQLIADWEGTDMAHGLPLPGCASCGIRDVTLEYSRRNVSELPTYFRLDAQRCRELELLGADGSNGVDLYSSDGSASRVDISPVVSSYQDHNTGERFHLHPKLVDESGDASTVLLCHHCDNKSMPPRMSIANNIDFGLLSRIDWMSMHSSTWA